MKTLYNKMSSENRTKLEEINKKYPTTFRLIKKELEEKSNYLHLTVGTAIDLAQYLNDTTDVTVSFLHDLFN
jgi:hypothetical protein